MNITRYILFILPLGAPILLIILQEAHLRHVLAIGLLMGCIAQPSISHGEGALAYGQYGNGGWAEGSAVNHRTKNEARRAAMNYCNARGYNCAIRVTFNNSCLALAVQDNGNGYAFSTRVDQETASQSAREQCKTYGYSCTIKRAICDNVSEQAIREAEQEQARQREQEYQEYIRHWRICFNSQASGEEQDSILACNQALEYPRGQYEDRVKLTNRRDNLIAEREQRDREALEEQQRKQRDAEEAAREAEQRKQDADDEAVRAEQRKTEAEEEAERSKQRARDAKREEPHINAPIAVRSKFSEFFEKPVPGTTAWLILAIFGWKALEKLINSIIPKKYKIITGFVFLGVELAISGFMGINLGEPKIYELTSIAVPIIGMVVVFGFFLKPDVA